MEMKSEEVESNLFFPVCNSIEQVVSMRWRHRATQDLYLAVMYFLNKCVYVYDITNTLTAKKTMNSKFRQPNTHKTQGDRNRKLLQIKQYKAFTDVDDHS